MTITEARAILDGVRAGGSSATENEISQALVVTGDLSGWHAPVPQRQEAWPYYAAKEAA